MNALANDQVFMRSLATRRQHLATSAVLADTVQLLKWAGFDLIVVETAGIGQSDSEIVVLVDLWMYVLTSEYGAASQLEKIDMLDFADFVVVNKFEKRGAEDALRDVRKQWRRNHPDQARLADDDVPVFPTIASQFNDAGVNRLFAAVCKRLDDKWGRVRSWPVAGPHRSRCRAGRRSFRAIACATLPRSRRARARLVNGSRRQRKPLVVRMAAIAPCRSSATVSCRRRSIATPMRSSARPTRRSPACAARTTSRSTRSATTASRV
jgi:putative protein kinase ArgK-like GTPase of G3E family